MKQLTTIILTFLLLSWRRVAAACSVCFYGEADTPAGRGLRWGVLTLLAVLLIIMAVFVQFLIKFKKRSKVFIGES